MKKILIFFASIMFSACGAMPPTFRETENDILIEKNKSLIYVYTGIEMHGAEPIGFFDNGVMQGKIGGSQYMKYFADPGLHKVKTDWSHTINIEETLTFEEGKVYFLKIKYYHDPMKYDGELRITPVYGKSALEDIKITRRGINKS